MSVSKSLVGKVMANVLAFKEDVFDYPPEVRRLVDEVFGEIKLADEEEVHVDFKNVYANERAIPEKGWAIFAETEEGLYAVFHDAEPKLGLYVTMRGSEYKAGASIVISNNDGKSMYATNAFDDTITHNVWHDDAGLLSIMAADFLYGFSCKS